MSMQKEVYVGAFLVVEADWVTDKQKDKYCRICGSRLVWKMMENDSLLADLYDIFPEEEYEDILLQIDDLDDDKSNQIILVGNLETNLEFPDCIDINDIGSFTITPSMPDTYIEDFRKQYADIIEELKKRTKSVLVEFGVLIYYT